MVDDEIGLGRDTGEDISIGIAPSGGAYIVPRSVRNLTGDQADLISDLQRSARVILDAQATIVDLLGHGRSMGLSWASLGWAIGLTDSGARRMVERADAIPGDEP